MLAAQLAFLSSQLQQTSPARRRVRIYCWHSRFFISETHSEPLSSGHPLSQTYFLKGSLGSRFFSSTMLKLKKQKKHKSNSSLLRDWRRNTLRAVLAITRAIYVYKDEGERKPRFLESQPAEAKKGCDTGEPKFPPLSFQTEIPGTKYLLI